MLGLERLSLEECVPTGSNGNADDHDDAYWNEAPGDTGAGRSRDDDEQAESDDGNVQVPVPGSSSSSNADRKKPIKERCKLCLMENSKKINPVGLGRVPDDVQGNRNTLYMRCCNAHRKWLRENPEECPKYKGGNNPPWPVDDPEENKGHRCKRFKKKGQPHCRWCARWSAQKKKAEKAAAKAAAQEKKTFNQKVKERQAKFAQIERAERAQLRKEAQEERERERRADKEATDNLKKKMDKYQELTPSKVSDKGPDDEKKRKQQEILDEWEQDMMARFGTLQQQQPRPNQAGPLQAKKGRKRK